VLLSSLLIDRVGLIVWVGVLDRLLSSSLGALRLNDVLVTADDVFRLVVVARRAGLIVEVEVGDHSHPVMMSGRSEVVCFQYLQVWGVRRPQQ
jgi:hypothetical protein